jgi:hypothetical protein
MIETNESRTRDIPIWLTGIVLLACLAGGGWLINWYMKDKGKQTVDITSEVTAAAANGNGRPMRTGGGNGSGRTFNGYNGNGGGGGGGYRTRAPAVDLSADGVQSYNSATSRVKSGNAVLLASNSPNGRLDLSYFKSVRTSEQEQLAMMFIAVRGDSNWREYLNVTDAQREMFAKVPPAMPGPAPMKSDPSDKAKLAPLWRAYRDAVAKNSADKATAEKALLTALDEVGQKNLQPTKDFEDARTAAIKAALTPEQVQKFLSASSDKAPLKPKEKAEVEKTIR